MKKRGMVILIAFLILLPGFAQSQPARPEPQTRPEALKILELEMSPDPVREGQWITFSLTLSNRTSHVGRANIVIKDRDEWVARLDNVWVEPGITEYPFPYNGYILQRFDHCFTVVMEVEGKPYNVETSRELCAKPLGWTMRP